MLQRIHHTKRFAAKMIIAFLIVILIPTTLTSVMYYTESASLVKQNVRESSLQLVRQAADGLFSILTAGTDASNVLYSDLKLQEAVRDTHPTPERKSANDEFVSDLVNNFVGANSFVKTLYVLREEGNSWGSGSFQLSKIYRTSIREQEWVKLARLKDGEPVFGPLSYDPLSDVGDRNDLVLPVARVIKDFDTLEDIGYLIVNVDGMEILNRIQQIKLGKTGRFFVVNEAGEVVIDGQTEDIGKRLAYPPLREWAVTGRDAEFEYELDGVRYYGIKQPLANGWSMIGTVPIHEIIDELTRLRTMVWTYAAVFALLAILVGLLLAGKVTKPIKQLTRQMKLAESGDFTVRTEVNSHDEIGHMSRQFNKMIKRIDELVQEVRQVQASKQQAELRAVMHRIHPHFLFNTLSTIKWLIRCNQSGKAYEALAALVLLLEANMGKKGQFVTVEEELDIVSKYLTILEIRYDRTFRFHVDLDPDVAQVRVPRLLIQPIVENAIFHGIVPQGTGGDIWLRAYGKQDAFVIEVRDNGRGISRQRLELLRAAGDEKDVGRDGDELIGIGLKHVYESVRLYFPPGSSCTIDSAEGEGTAVRMELVKGKYNGLATER